MTDYRDIKVLTCLKSGQYPGHTHLLSFPPLSITAQKEREVERERPLEVRDLEENCCVVGQMQIASFWNLKKRASTRDHPVPSDFGTCNEARRSRNPRQQAPGAPRSIPLQRDNGQKSQTLEVIDVHGERAP